MAHTQQSFPIVGIGASAGGLKAIEELFEHLPANTGMAYVIVQHLSRKYKSLMQEILAKDTKMPVIMAEDGLSIGPDQIYLIPAGYELSISDYKFEVTKLTDTAGPTFVIDKFLHTLGNSAGTNSIGIILSGTGSDGSRGIRTVKESGGLVIVQEPDSGEFDGMPQSAIDTMTADFILPPREIAEKLLSLSQLERKKAGQGFNGESIQVVPTAYQRIFELVKEAHQVDFSLYKKPTIIRRIDKQLAIHNFLDLEDYVEFLETDPANVTSLYHELLIGVTQFFRDQAAFEVFDELVIPKLFDANAAQKELRIWVCGCSTGEEVYSIAIRLEEFLQTYAHPVKYTILATDVNEGSLAYAGRGRFEESKLVDIPADLIEKYFVQDEHGYEIVNSIREHIIFARNDATTDPPFINLDLVVCRNLLIYFKPEIQKKLLLNFHFGLRPEGLLWLGGSENVLDLKSIFKTLNSKWKVFSSTGETPKYRKTFSLRHRDLAQPTGTSKSSRFTQQALGGAIPSGSRFSYAKRLLERFVPTSLLIDHEYFLHYVNGGAGKYLSIPDWDMSQNVLNMLPQSLSLLVRDSVRRLQAETGPFLYRDLQLAEFPDLTTIRMSVLDADSGTTLFLMEFNPSVPKEDGSTMVRFDEVSTLDADAFDVIQSLQEELNVARLEIQNSLEELESSNEELQASNEELLAANEELQSTNEELQSVNEELYTVNSELQARNKDLTEANLSIDNLIISTDVAIVFLDQYLNIQFFSPQIRTVLPLEEKDLNTPISKFQFSWKYEEFLQDLDYVLTEEEPILKEIEGAHSHEYFEVKIFPMSKSDPRGGLIVTVTDSSLRKQTELKVQSSADNLRRVLNAHPEIVSMIDPNGDFLYLNKVEVGFNLDDVVGTSVFTYMPEEQHEIVREAMATADESNDRVVYISYAKGADGSDLKYRNTLVPLKDVDGETNAFLIASTNISDEQIVPLLKYRELKLAETVVGTERLVCSVKDESLAYLYANNTLCQLLDRQQGSFLGSKNSYVLPEEFAEAVSETDKWVVQNRKSRQVLESYPTKEGTIRYAIMNKSIFRHEDGKDYLISIGTLLDDEFIVDETGNFDLHFKLKERLENRTQTLLQTNKELQTLTQSMAHDLRGPLRAINMYAQLLERESEELGPQSQEYLSNVQVQSKRMSDIVNGLLDYVKIGTTEVQKVEINLEDLAAKVWEELSYMHPENASISISEIEPVQADYHLMHRVLVNLLSNSLKYHEPGRPLEIEIGSYQDHQTGKKVFFVKDNGQGFDKSQAEKVFEVFRRSTLSDSIEGYGLGLSIVKRAIELQGGAVKAKSSLGKGARFLFSLPSEGVGAQ